MKISSQEFAEWLNGLPPTAYIDDYDNELFDKLLHVLPDDSYQAIDPTATTDTSKLDGALCERDDPKPRSMTEALNEWLLAAKTVTFTVTVPNAQAEEALEILSRKFDTVSNREWKLVELPTTHTAERPDEIGWWINRTLTGGSPESTILVELLATGLTAYQYGEDPTPVASIPSGYEWVGPYRKQLA